MGFWSGIVSRFDKTSSWFGKAFSDDGQPSSSRVLTVIHSLSACFVLIFVAVVTHTYPDSVQGAALGGFAVAPYAVNRITTAWGKDKDKPDQQ